MIPMPWMLPMAWHRSSGFERMQLSMYFLARACTSRLPCPLAVPVVV
jgi:hypothetical protein